MQITKDIRYIGVNDHEVDLFEGQYVVPNGMAYNSYVIIDEKIAVMDTADVHFKDEWMANLKAALDGRSPDYLRSSHTWSLTIPRTSPHFCRSTRKLRLSPPAWLSP